jgi:hypothetical protein
VRYALPQLIHGPFGFYPLFSAGEHVILRNSSIRFQGVQLPDVVYSVVRSSNAVGPHVRALCGVGPCDTVCELVSVHPTTPAGLVTRTLYVQQNLVGADVVVHVRFGRGKRVRSVIAMRVGSRVMSNECSTGTIIRLNRKSVRVIRDDGHIETWRLRSIAEVA